MKDRELATFYVEFVGSLQVRWGIEVTAISSAAAEEEARRSLPESSDNWSLGDGTNPVIDVEMVSCTTQAPEISDRDLGRLELEHKYSEIGGDWGHHPVHTRPLWQHCVACEDTVDGYWDWVYNKLQNEDEPDEPEHQV